MVKKSFIALIVCMVLLAGCTEKQLQVLDKLTPVLQTAIVVAVALYLDENPEHAAEMERIAIAVQQTSGTQVSSVSALTETINRLVPWDKLSAGQRLAASTLISAVTLQVSATVESEGLGAPDQVVVRVKEVMGTVAFAARQYQQR